jgi:hypothetical protein
MPVLMGIDLINPMNRQTKKCSSSAALGTAPTFEKIRCHVRKYSSKIKYTVKLNLF